MTKCWAPFDAAKIKQFSPWLFGTIAGVEHSCMQVTGNMLLGWCTSEITPSCCPSSHMINQSTKSYQTKAGLCCCPSGRTSFFFFFSWISFKLSHDNKGSIQGTTLWTTQNKTDIWTQWALKSKCLHSHWQIPKDQKKNAVSPVHLSPLLYRQIRALSSMNFRVMGRNHNYLVTVMPGHETELNFLWPSPLIPVTAERVRSSGTSYHAVGLK